MPEFRKNALSGKLVVIAPARAGRPKMSKIESATNGELVHHDGNCPFCYGNEFQTPLELTSYRTDDSLPNTKGWKIRVVPNKFPAFDINETYNDGLENSFCHVAYAYGYAEIIIESPDHSKNPALFDLTQIELLIQAYKDRIIALKSDEKIKYVLPFRNNGKQAGASLAHPHSQIIALPLVPQSVETELLNAHNYNEVNNKCLLCTLLENEIQQKDRIVLENDDFVAFCPSFSQFSFETWIVPKNHQAKFENITENEIKSFSKIYKVIMLKIYKELNNIPYNYYIQSAPEHRYSDDFHWYFRIIPKFSIPAGFELGADIAINTSIPEDCASFLRNTEV